jgi:hypothetical protein
MAAERAVTPRIDKEPADSEGSGIGFHGRCESSKNSRD